jgi:hypothetical protein
MAGSHNPNEAQSRSATGRDRTEVGLRRAAPTIGGLVVNLIASALEAVVRHQPDATLILEQGFGAASDLAARFRAIEAPQTVEKPVVHETRVPPLVVTTPRAPELSGAELEAGCAALCCVYPTRNALKMMLRFRCERKLDELVGDGPQWEVVFELVTKAQSDGWVGELLQAADDHVPGNEVLRRLAAKHSETARRARKQ